MQVFFSLFFLESLFFLYLKQINLCNDEALEGGVPVSHIPLIILKNIPYP